ncbi:cation:proton antiporter [Candidatus Peregrinibacteria bacterium]|nr:cation:proton antiporter [Candidatus Peregrinibacteria bacterium]
MRRYLAPLVVIGLLPLLASATGGDTTQTHSLAPTFFWMAVLLVAAKISGLIERIGQPAVLGELLIGVLLGNLHLFGITIMDAVKENELLLFLAELGVVILLFQIGLESNIQQMLRVGPRALLVATVGVIVPFALGTAIVGPLVLPGLPANAYLFLGAALTATSVGITARVFRDLGKLQSPEARIVLGAAVLDDVMGLIILAVVSAIATEGSIGLANITLITAKALLFLIGAILVGYFTAPTIGKFFAKIHSGSGMKLTLAIGMGLLFAAAAQWIGLAPIVGAFAAGLVLDPVHFHHFKDPEIITDIRKTTENLHPTQREKILQALQRHSHRHVEELIEPLGHFLVPLFFLMIGLKVELALLAQPTILLTALAITVAAFAGKIVSGAVAGKVRKSIVGWGMVPRGEVGLIFASMGLSIGVISKDIFSVIVIMVILTTLFTPPILTLLLKREESKN